MQGLYVSLLLAHLLTAAVPDLIHLRLQALQLLLQLSDSRVLSRVRLVSSAGLRVQIYQARYLKPAIHFVYQLL